MIRGIQAEKCRFIIGRGDKMRIVFALLYLLIGTFFMGFLPDSSGKPVGVMIILWPLFVPILAIAKIFDVVFRIGAKLSRKL